jgi:Tol biopolymer transport system component
MLMALGAASAEAAGPGETFLVGGLPLPAGAIAGGAAGRGGEPEDSAVSADGRYVAFVAGADALAPEAGLDLANVFRKDRQTGAVVLVSRADGVGGMPAARSGREVTISDDGSRVGWVTDAAVDPGDGDGEDDVYVRDLDTGQTLLATGGIASRVSEYDLSGDGAWIAFATDLRLDAANDVNSVNDVYRREISSGATTLVSRAEGLAGAIGDSSSGMPSIDDDGRLIAFASTARNLISGFVAGSGYDVFVRDVAAGRTRLVSHALGNARRGSNDDSETPEIAGGSATIGTATVAWDSRATDLDADDGDDSYSVFVRTLSGTPRLVSRADGPAGASADGYAYNPSLSDDGERVAFAAQAGNMGTAPNDYGAYVRDLPAARTTLLSAGSGYAVLPAIAGGGGYVAWFDQYGAAYGADPTLDLVVGRAYATPPAPLGAAEPLSRPAGDAPYFAPAFDVAQPKQGARAISGDGRYVLLLAESLRLEGGASLHAYRRDTVTGALELVSRTDGAGGAPVPRGVTDASISADGNRVVFTTSSSLAPADAGDDQDVYVRDLAAGTTRLASRADGPGGADGNRDAVDGRISGDGRHVAFVSSATNLGVAGGRRHVYLRDLADGRTVLVDRADGAGAPGNGDAGAPSPSSDGRFVAFATVANNLDADDPAPFAVLDVYVRDLQTGETQLVSRRTGVAGAKSTRTAADPVISGNGRVVAFQAYDETLAPEGGAWGPTTQIVARDLTTQQTTLVSRAPGGAAGDWYSSRVSVDDSGDVIAFESASTNLLPGRGGTVRSAVFARTLSTGALAGPPAFGLVSNEPQNRAAAPSLSGDGQCMAFVGLGHNEATGSAGDFETAYVHVVAGSCPKALPVDPPRPPVDPPRPPFDPPRGRVPETRLLPLEAPRLTNVSLLRKRFRVGRGATAVTAVTAATRRGARRGRGRKPAPAGTAFRFTLNARANVSIAIERGDRRGRKAGRGCRRATPRLRRRPRCTLWTKVGALRRGGVDGGRRSIAFSGRIGSRALRAGSYRATLTAGNASGSAKPVTLRFTIVRT